MYKHTIPNMASSGIFPSGDELLTTGDTIVATSNVRRTISEMSWLQHSASITFLMIMKKIKNISNMSNEIVNYYL